MKIFVLWCALALAPVGLVVPASAQKATNLMTAPIIWPTIDNAGDDIKPSPSSVMAVQYLLRARGFYKGRADGIYSPKTILAVKNFQRRNGLKADGVAGPQTLPKLVVMVKRGSKGDVVRASQILARAVIGENGETPNGGLEVDGTFGKETERAVRTAQRWNNYADEHLKVDGIMGPRSWCLLLGGKVVGAEM